MNPSQCGGVTCAKPSASPSGCRSAGEDMSNAAVLEMMRSILSEMNGLKQQNASLQAELAEMREARESDKISMAVMKEEVRTVRHALDESRHVVERLKRQLDAFDKRLVPIEVGVLPLASLGMEDDELVKDVFANFHGASAVQNTGSATHNSSLSAVEAPSSHSAWSYDFLDSECRTLSSSQGPAPRNSMGTPSVGTPLSMQSSGSLLSSLPGSSSSSPNPLGSASAQSRGRPDSQAEMSERALVSLAVSILTDHGSVPVGKMGSLLHKAANNHSLPALLKERYGGLKKFLQSHTDEFVLGTDHPYNPHVYLRKCPTNSTALPPSVPNAAEAASGPTPSPHQAYPNLGAHRKSLSRPDGPGVNCDVLQMPLDVISSCLPANQSNSSPRAFSYSYSGFVPSS